MDQSGDDPYNDFSNELLCQLVNNETSDIITNCRDYHHGINFAQKDEYLNIFMKI